MTIGIYCIENIINGKKYIGQSVNIEKRQVSHMSALKNNNHKNSYLQHAYNLYGEKSFVFKILLYCEANKLTYYEQFFVNYFLPNGLYNIRKDCVDSNIGVAHSEETKKKIKESNIGKNKGKPSSRLGATLSEETKKKISSARIGLYSGKNHPLYGKFLSDETKKKISEKNKGKIPSEKARENMSKSQTGRVMSEETKLKISKSNGGRKFPKSSSNFFGVSKDTTNYKNKTFVYWKATIHFKGTRVILGKFKTEEEAALKYDEYVIKNNLERPLNILERNV